MVLSILSSPAADNDLSPPPSLRREEVEDIISMSTSSLFTDGTMRTRALVVVIVVVVASAVSRSLFG